MIVDADSGLSPNKDTKKTIYESFKIKDNILVGLKNISDKDTLELYDSKKNKTILKFY